MSSSDSSPTPPPLPADASTVGRAARGKWQFSMKTLMLATTGVALFFGFAAALPASFSQALLGLIWIAATGWLATGVVFAKGDQRAFCIGALIMISSTWTRLGGRFIQGMFEIFTLLSGGSQLPHALNLWIEHLLLFGAAVANGWFCVYARHYFESTAPAERE